jgi:hypothetical protein
MSIKSVSIKSDKARSELEAIASDFGENQA